MRRLYTRCHAAKRKNAAFAAFLQSSCDSVLGLFDDLVGSDPRHHGTQLLADHFNAMGSIVTTVSSHRRVVGSPLADEHLGIFAVLNALQRIAHGGTRLL